MNDYTRVHHDEGFANVTHVEDTSDPGSKEYARSFEGMEDGGALRFHTVEEDVPHNNNFIPCMKRMEWWGRMSVLLNYARGMVAQGWIVICDPREPIFPRFFSWKN